MTLLTVASLAFRFAAGDSASLPSDVDLPVCGEVRGDDPARTAV